MKDFSIFGFNGYTVLMPFTEVLFWYADKDIRPAGGKMFLLPIKYYQDKNPK